MFSLSFIENPDRKRVSFDAETEIVGKICLNDFEEYFAADVTFLAADDYHAQWRDGLSRTCAGAARSCVLTSITRPEISNYFNTWPIYRVGSDAIFHNRLLMLDQIDEPFLFSRLYDTILRYSAISEDGEPFSEWKIPVRTIQEFLETSSS